MKNEFVHRPVLLKEAIENLAINPNGLYVDGTYGRGGHSNEILKYLSEAGRLYAFDRDITAVHYAQQRHGDDERFKIYHEPFINLYQVMNEQGLCQTVDGILLDLGVSSPQLDDAERGFSFMQDGPLDMRMDTTQGVTVAQWLMIATESELADILYQYGEERFSRRIARAIVEAQHQQPITTTQRLAEIISAANPKWEHNKHPATRSFQALRIFINQELEQLQNVLAQCLQVLKIGGRLTVISFHSLEDRIVKNFFRPQQAVKGLPLTDIQLTELSSGFKSLGKAIQASKTEIIENPRSRSAVLRIAEKVK